MKLRAILVLVIVGAGLNCQVQASGDFSGNANLYLGAKSLDSNDWGDTDNQFAIGGSLDAKKENWPIHLAVEAIGSFGSGSAAGIDITSSVYELGVGVRKYMPIQKSFSVFVGGGPALLFGSIQEDGLRIDQSLNVIDVNRSDSDMGLGFWIGGGVLFNLSDKLNLGASIRYSQGDVKIFDQTRDAGGLLMNLIGGIRF